MNGRIGLVIIILLTRMIFLSASPYSPPDTLTIRPKDVKSTVPIIYLPDSLIQDSLKYEYIKIKEMASRSTWGRELYKFIFVNPKPNQLNVMRTQNSEERFREYEGKQIERIDVLVLSPYGKGVYDTIFDAIDLGFIKNVANKIHMRTSEGTLRRQLTVKAGSVVRPFELAQNEIILRDLAFIDDAAIFLQPSLTDSSKVIMNVICKDEFSWGVEVNTNFSSNVNLEIANKNFLRRGHYIEYEWSHRGKKDIKTGNVLKYNISSLGGSHIDFSFLFQNDYYAKQVGISFDRQFLTSNMKWAGGIAGGRVFRCEDLPGLQIENQKIPFDYWKVDVWGGKSFSLEERYNYTRNLYVTGRMLSSFFVHRPEVSVDSNHFYYNRQTYLLSFTYRKLRYYRANLIYDFGRTEVIPTGFYSAVTMGYENNEFQNSGYIGYEARYSHFNKHTERFYAVDGGIASYVNDRKAFERGLIKVGAHHISNLINLGFTRFRIYNDVNYIRGIKRYPNDHLYIEEYNMRGFSSDSTFGDQKLSTSLSTTYFLPFIKRGFRTAISTFVDMGVLGRDKRSIFKGKTYWGIGFAVSVRNENIAIKNISIRLAFYPTVPVDVRRLDFHMSGKPERGFYDYRILKPDVILYE